MEYQKKSIKKRTNNKTKTLQELSMSSLFLPLEKIDI